MGTPLKSLSTVLSPKLLSPLSPKLLNLPTKNEHVNDINVFRSSSNKAVRRLNYGQTDNSKCQPVSIFVTNTENKVVPKNDILLNTPIKRIILKKGLEGFLNILGKGHFGKVVRGLYKGETVAIKVVKNMKSHCREVNALNLNHPNIVRTLDITENINENYTVIVMQYFENSLQLHNMILNKDYKMDNIIRLSVDICEGLRYCHVNNVLHLDLKPQNILVCDGVCKICDFGNSALKFKTNDFTNQGTPFYTAPELLMGNEPTEKCDIYSLGIIFWQMQNRQLPYSSFDNLETVMYQVVKHDLRPEPVSPDCKFSQLYKDCWNSNPSFRPELSKLIEQLAQLF